MSQPYGFGVLDGLKWFGASDGLWSISKRFHILLVSCKNGLGAQTNRFIWRWCQAAAGERPSALHSQCRCSFERPFYWIQFHHDFQVCLPLSPFYWILFRHAFQFTDLDACLPSVLLNFLYKDPFLLWFGGVSYFVFPSIFLAGA